jgi:non-ribosomal peptide synthetase component E (peptide arylation enzyme)
MFTFRKQKTLEVETRQAQLLGEIAELQQMIRKLGDDVRSFQTMLADSTPLLDRYEQTAEKVLEQVSLTNDAQASRYAELKKRLDSYDKVFQQLGILIGKQPVIG